MLEINNLQVKVKNQDKTILSQINLEVKSGEVVFLMGKNGSGKSTLGQVIMGNPNFESSGSIYFDGKEISELSNFERSQAGIFVSFQHPIEIKGVSIVNYLKTIINKHREATNINKLSSREVLELVKSKLELLNWNKDFLKRDLNYGMSGGEKKKSEILQMLVLDSKLVILDEIDSGLDIDAMEIIFNIVKEFINKDKVIIIITHNSNILKYIKPNKVIVLNNGKIEKIGKSSLVEEIFKNGF
jgi:Fe-S cluster assembly ATP-binding protein